MVKLGHLESLSLLARAEPIALHTVLNSQIAGDVNSGTREEVLLRVTFHSYLCQGVLPHSALTTCCERLAGNPSQDNTPFCLGDRRLYIQVPGRVKHSNKKVRAFSCSKCFRIQGRNPASAGRGIADEAQKRGRKLYRERLTKNKSSLQHGVSKHK